VRDGDQLTMQCIEVNNRDVLFEWSKVDGTLSWAARVDEQNGLLEIAFVSADDAGPYRCRATNQAGRSDAFAEVLIAGS